MIVNETKGRAWRGRVELADTFFKRFKGLMLTGNVDYSLVFILPVESRLNASIHTLFMLSDIDVIWLDSSRRAVDFRRAKRWRVYAPKKPAKYIIEGPVGLIRTLDVEEGDLIDWYARGEGSRGVPAMVSLPAVPFEKANGFVMAESVEELKAGKN